MSDETNKLDAPKSIRELRELPQWLDDELACYERQYGFTSGSGYAQVNGKGEHISNAFGRYESLLIIKHIFSSKTPAVDAPKRDAREWLDPEGW
jgi:hypothetical protein